ncbi:hypothetical protein E4T43_00939 [Aureobasidium subglaciale]|nr:hypothetical protein E4T43_00939 [Aureobasidium subglaciale]
MPPIIHCVRHAEGFHNLNVAAHALHDPLLTSKGEEQCKSLQSTFPSMDHVDAVIASPMKRTIWTALLSFAPAIKSKQLKVYALPELQETSDLPCDTGSKISDLEAEFKGQPIDWSYMHTPPAKAWNVKSGKWSATASAVDDRARIAREWLYSRPEKEIVVVTHGGFLHYLTEDWMDKHSTAGKGWRNTECRSYTFGKNPKSGRPILLETSQSLAKRVGNDTPLSREEQTNLHRVNTKQKAEEEKAYQKATGIQAKV